jgi:hypothetical protein
MKKMKTKNLIGLSLIPFGISLIVVIACTKISSINEGNLKVIKQLKDGYTYTGIHSRSDYDSIFDNDHDSIMNKISSYTHGVTSENLVWDSSDMSFHGFFNNGMLLSELNEHEFNLFIEKLTCKRCYSEEEWSHLDSNLQTHTLVNHNDYYWRRSNGRGCHPKPGGNCLIDVDDPTEGMYQTK